MILSNTDQSIVLRLLKTLRKCGPNTEAFYASVVAIYPLGSCIRMTLGEDWWLVSPPERKQTLSHASLGMKRIEGIFSAWCEDHAAFASAIASSTASCTNFSRSFASNESPLPIPRVW